MLVSQAEQGKSGMWREIELPPCFIARNSWRIDAAEAGMRQAAQPGTQSAVGIELFRLAREAHDGVAVLHDLPLEGALREETQTVYALHALPVPTRVGRDDADAPAMRQPDAEPELLLLAMRVRQVARTV